MFQRSNPAKLVTPAQAGVHVETEIDPSIDFNPTMDSRLRGNDHEGVGKKWMRQC
jgi:hypothetical protein